jgi:hypothetical protein
MSIYGDLMKLNQAQTGQQPKPKPKQPLTDEAASPILSEKSAAALPKAKASKPLVRVKTYSNKHTVIPRHHDTTQPSMVARYHDTMIERIRAAVKAFGKEAATHRFTPEEKKAITDIVYTYKIQGVRTSENEVARIAINFIVHDYKENGENSILHRAIKALNE